MYLCHGEISAESLGDCSRLVEFWVWLRRDGIIDPSDACGPEGDALAVTWLDLFNVHSTFSTSTHSNPSKLREREKKKSTSTWTTKNNSLLYFAQKYNTILGVWEEIKPYDKGDNCQLQDLYSKQILFLFLNIYIVPTLPHFVALCFDVILTKM